ncbi:group III truncated hemoglobin [Chryseolinea sp. T2]|uniref:group III truncated hemoglobin n=1 Tax=Chryseolinea sp. T2 TaxID=3129255 RepID=UPI003077925B
MRIGGLPFVALAMLSLIVGLLAGLQRIGWRNEIIETSIIILKNNMDKHDIISRNDIIALVDSFYEKVKANALLGPVFSHVDWPKHLPVMYGFWSSMLLGETSYSGNPLQSHLPLPIDSTHFNQWLALFEATLDELFAGERTEETRMRARAIAGVFQHKMGLKI